MNINERKKALESILRQKIGQLQVLETQKNEITTEVVKTQGKIELLGELEHESPTKSPVQKEGKKE